MPAADQVVSVPAAGRPPVLRGHRQPLVAAEHVLLGGPVPVADGKDARGDQAAQHRPRDRRLHVRPGGRGSVMEAGQFASEPVLPMMREETITKRRM